MRPQVADPVQASRSLAVAQERLAPSDPAGQIRDDAFSSLTQAWTLPALVHPESVARVQLVNLGTACCPLLPTSCPLANC